MSIEFDHNGGCHTMSKTPEMALLHWYRATLPMPNLEGVEPFTVISREMKHPTEGIEFIQLCVSATERHFNKTPEIDQRASFSKQARDFILWLAKENIITNLTDNGELA